MCTVSLMPSKLQIGFVHSCKHKWKTTWNEIGLSLDCRKYCWTIATIHSFNEANGSQTKHGIWFHLNCYHVFLLATDRNFLLLNHSLKYCRLSRICVMKGLQSSLPFFILCPFAGWLPFDMMFTLKCFYWNIFIQFDTFGRQRVK